MDHGKTCRGLADILGAQEYKPAAVNKIQVLSSAASKSSASRDQQTQTNGKTNGWIRHQITMFEDHLEKLLLRINWLQQSLQEEQSSRLSADEQVECLQQMVLEQAAKLQELRQQVDRCFEEIQALHLRWERVEERLETERVENLHVGFPAFISDCFQWIRFSGWRCQVPFAARIYFSSGTTMEMKYQPDYTNGKLPRLEEVEAGVGGCRTPRRKVVVPLRNRQVKHNVQTLRKKVIRLCKLANKRAQILKGERRQRAEAERKLDDLSASWPKAERATQAPDEQEAGASALEPKVEPKSKIGSLASRILQLKGTTGRLLKDLEGAYSMMDSNHGRNGIVQRRSELREDTRKFGLKLRLQTMEQQLHELEGMAFHKAQDLEQKLCMAFEARLNALEQQKWSLRKRLQEKSLEVKHERTRREESELQAQAERSQRAETSDNNSSSDSGGEFKSLRAEVDRITGKVMDAIQDVERHRDEYRESSRLSRERFRQRDMVWRQGLMALEQTLLLCVAAFLLFSRALYAPVALPPT